MTHPRIRQCAVFPLCRTFGKAARNGQDRSLQTTRKAAIIPSGFSPVWTRNIPGCRTLLSPTACGRSPLAEGAKRGAHLSENVIRRGAFYMRPRKSALPQTGTGGYGIRPYVFEGRALPVPCPLCQHHQRQLYKHGCRLLVLLHRQGAVYLPDCHVQRKLLLAFIHKL